MTPRLLAIVPAAGHSRRMGQPKLLLDLAGKSVLARVIEALHLAGVAHCLVVVRPDDAALIQEVRTAGAEVVIPAMAPEEMRQSVECGLRHVHSTAQTAGEWDGWVLVPADHPTLNPAVIRELIAVWSESPQQIAVPVFGGRRGHPTIFPWSMVPEVLALPAERGLNQLLRSRPERVQEVPVSDPRVLDDLDTPEDWERLCREFDVGEPPTVGWDQLL